MSESISKNSNDSAPVHRSDSDVVPIPHVAIVGAGISGLIAARTLQEHGIKVSVFEKSRGVGGRMATRRLDDGLNFDHGAQYFTVRDRGFSRHVDSWIEQGIVKKWPDPDLGPDQKIVIIENGKIGSESDSQDRFVAVPTMNSICKRLAENMDIKTQTRVKTITRVEGGVELFDESSQALGRFDRLLVSAPAAQSSDLLEGFPELASTISKITMNSCWAAMVAFPMQITDQWAGAFLHDSFLTWACRNGTKPGRIDDVDQLVLHSDHEWAQSNWERNPDDIAETILTEFFRVSGIQRQPVSHLNAHRWKYALAIEPADNGFFISDCSIAVCCGDWANGSRVEGAFLSGLSVAESILSTLSNHRQPS